MPHKTARGFPCVGCAAKKTICFLFFRLCHGALCRRAVLHRVDRFSVHRHLKMQMRCIGYFRNHALADAADHIPRLHFTADGKRRGNAFCQIAIAAFHAGVMAQRDAPAAKRIIDDLFHRAVRAGDHIGANRRIKIHAGVRACGNRSSSAKRLQPYR